MDILTPDPLGREQRLDEILAGYLKEVSAGRAPHRDALLDNYPDLAPELTAFFDDRERFDRLAAPLRLLATGPVSFPAQINGYDLETEIARGGMGVIWKAHQRGLNRTVVLKMLRAGVLAGATHLRRFQAEAEAVAALDHPRIVPVYEVGEYEGQPYLAMKYMEGGSLADHLEPFLNAPYEAAQLLAEVAEAVQYAHRHGVLHRDLKPANILLDAEGRPHVSDFGLAKRLSTSESQSGPAGLTQTGDLLGTPSYMAPEQARGDQHAVTVATDVYGLGTILYELLTGRPPFRGAGVLDTLKLIQDQLPLAPRRVQPGVNRDLETVCLKALEKEPGQRYSSVGALADDLRRFLAGEPVQARAVGPLGNAWRWCRRRPALAGLGLALLAALAGGFAAVTWQWQRAEKHLRQAEDNFARAEYERERAEANLQQAEESFRQAHEAVNEFCVRLSDNQLNALSGSQHLRHDLLEAGLRYYEQFLARKVDEPRLRTELAGIYRRLGLINATIGKRAEALAALEQSRKILEERAPEVTDPTRGRGELARTYLAIAQLQVSNGQLLAALESFAEAEKGLKFAADAMSGDAKDAADFAAVLLAKGRLCVRLGRLDEARECYEKQIDLLSKLAPGRPVVVVDLAAGHIEFGNLQVDLGRREAAIRSFEKTRTLLEPAGRSAPSNDRSKELLASCLVALGGQQIVGGRMDDALRTLQKARSLLERLGADNPDVLQYVQELSACLRQTGHAYRESKRPADALNCYDKAKGLMEQLVRQDATSGEFQNDLAKCLFDLAGLQYRTGKEADGLLNFKQSAALRKKLVAAEPANLFFRCDLGLTLSNVALGMARQGQLPQGLEAARESAEQQRAAFAGAPRVAIFRKYLAGACRRVADLALSAGNTAEAVAVTRERRELYPADGTNLYGCAADFARAAALADKSNQGSAESRSRSREYGGLALETLRLALRAGFKDADKLRKDAAFACFRDRPEFEKLLAECEKAASLRQ
jgi:eukaryotic-like serine/threonine-protein kinase